MDRNLGDDRNDDIVRVTIELRREVVDWIDQIRDQLGFRRRDIVIEQLLTELLTLKLDEGSNKKDKTIESADDLSIDESD
jgi:metal-responsive CopG/Arc/MetJ family transcriptional regulator